MCIMFPGFNWIWNKTKPTGDRERNRKLLLFQFFYLKFQYIWTVDLIFFFLILAFDQFIQDFSMGHEPDGVAAIASTSWPGRNSKHPSSDGSPSSPKSTLPQSQNTFLRTSEACFQTPTPNNGILKRFYSFIVVSAEELAARSLGLDFKLFFKILWASCKLVSFNMIKKRNLLIHKSWRSSVFFVAHLAQINRKDVCDFSPTSSLSPGCDYYTFGSFCTSH